METGNVEVHTEWVSQDGQWGLVQLLGWAQLKALRGPSTCRTTGGPGHCQILTSYLLTMGILLG